jgi:hypothetical protein
VNVAGEGDEEEANEDALKKVQNAIGEHPEETYTITLSCGRLTTGCFCSGMDCRVYACRFIQHFGYFLYANHFPRADTCRNQRTRKRRMFRFRFCSRPHPKGNCRNSQNIGKSRKTTMSDRETMGEFLNFCPIIAIEGSRMKPTT